ncbi:MAG: undecaprenyldiphospho-muramoylpentapeptide beta-N-acetylglucosaminyltransferase [Bacteroidales bacterium]
MKNKKYIISGGGTGGHIFPALAIANELKAKYPEVEILFIGAEGKMEMERVPAAGYKIIGLPIRGFDRKNMLKNIPIGLKLAGSLLKAFRVIRSFKPDAVIGVGGYASGPTLKIAQMLGIPTIIQEQNSYAGVTNKLLAKKADRICVAYEGMERFFPKDKIVLTGNPVRQNLMTEVTKEEALAHFGLVPGKKTVLIIGGSLGARTMNMSMLGAWTGLCEEKNVQFIWQTGKLYYDKIEKLICAGKPDHIYVQPFIDRMDLAYKAADLVVSRAGASSISEICLLGKASILVPSPNVAEDHQMRNAEAMLKKNAAWLVRDDAAEEKLIPALFDALADDEKRGAVAANADAMALRDSAKRILEEIERGR